jgi:xanthine dehydrogenase large subunit
VQLLEGSPNSEDTIYRSKAVGEPPLMLAISAWMAIRDAVASCGPARALPDLVAPATPETVLRCLESINAGTMVYQAAAVSEEAGA